MRKTVEAKSYEQWEIMDYAEKVVQTCHQFYANQEKTKGQKLYDTFGDWKQNNPNSPIAQMNYPNNEYLQVISVYKDYFDKIYAEREELL